MLLADFRSEFDEFAALSDAKVQARLDEAARQTPASVWGAKRDDGIKWLAAHLCVLDPACRDLRDDKDKSGQSRYLARRKALESVVASGWRITGGV